MIPALLLACAAPRPGTAVGNPGDVAVPVKKLDEGVSLDAVTVPVASLVLPGCRWPGLDVDVPVVLDGLAPRAVTVPVPPGRWCGLGLELDGPIEVTGSTSAGTTFVVELDVALQWPGVLAIDGQSLLLELPLALEAAALDALGPDVSLPSDDPLAVAWAELASAEGRVIDDLDRDGVVSPEDPVLLAGAALDSGALPASAGAASTGCGCAGVGGVGGWGWLLGLLLWRCKRR